MARNESGCSHTSKFACTHILFGDQLVEYTMVYNDFSFADMQQSNALVQSQMGLGGYGAPLQGVSDLSQSGGMIYGNISQQSKPVETSETKQIEKPKRPLSAYNIFFKHERGKILSTTPTRAEGKPRRSHGKIGFAELARTIAAKWNKIDPETRAQYDKLAADDKRRYVAAMDVWKKQQKEQEMAVKSAPIKREVVTSDFEPLSLNILLNQEGMAPSAYGQESNNIEGFRPSFQGPMASQMWNPQQQFPSTTLPQSMDSLYFPSTSAVDSFAANAGMFHQQTGEDGVQLTDLATKLDGDCFDFFVNSFR